MDSSAATNAFTATTFFSGYAGAMGYFIFPFCERDGMLWTVCSCGVIGTVCYLAAFVVHSRKRAEVPETEKKAMARKQFWERLHTPRRGQLDVSEVTV